jgi:hypothetical protein
LPADLIVSLTSYPARFGTLHLTLRCLLNQSIKPDQVLLWVSPQDEPLLTQAVKKLAEQGLQVRTTNDIGSFKKIIPSLMEFPNSFVITADDDVFYPSTWLETLVRAWDGRYELIVCHQARRFRINRRGEPLPYRLWPNLRSPEESVAVFPIGGGGVLFPPGSLAPDVIDEATFMQLCPKADDLWLYWMARRAGSTFLKVGSSSHPLNWPGSQKVALKKDNLHANANDGQIAALVRAFGTPSVERDI